LEEAEMIQQKVVGIAVIALGVAGGVIFIIHGRNTGSESAAPLTPLAPSVPSVSIPTPAWYEAHPDALKEGNSRCAAQGKNMPPGLCANVDIADKAVSSKDAINALDQAGSSGK
jgi:hypothetical protein